jgi:hypothetical protein
MEIQLHLFLTTPVDEVKFRIYASTAFHYGKGSYIYIYIYIYIYAGCPRRNVPEFGRMFFKLKYTDITQNTYIQSWTVTDIMAREKCGLLAVPRTVPVRPTRNPYTAHVRP